MKNEVDIEFTVNRSKHKTKQFFKYRGWYEEFLSSDAQYRMTYAQFKKRKEQQIKSKRKRK